MNDADKRELTWYREQFNCRFMNDNIPKPGTSLLGYRFTIIFECGPGDFRPWSNFEPHNVGLQHFAWVES